MKVNIFSFIFLLVLSFQAQSIDITNSIEGKWEGKGLDDEGTTWDWTMQVFSIDQHLEGSFLWKGSNGSFGTEHFTGTYDFMEHKFIFNGYQVENYFWIIPGIYEGKYNEENQEISGIFYGEGGIPGEFSGKKVVNQ